jgi:hypothetical protein
MHDAASPRDDWKFERKPCRIEIRNHGSDPLGCIAMTQRAA